MTSYPLAPWTLRGHAVHTLRLVDRVRARTYHYDEMTLVAHAPRVLGRHASWWTRR